jgi:hypothetical protein
MARIHTSRLACLSIKSQRSRARTVPYSARSLHRSNLRPAPHHPLPGRGTRRSPRKPLRTGAPPARHLTVAYRRLATPWPLVDRRAAGAEHGHALPPIRVAVLKIGDILGRRLTEISAKEHCLSSVAEGLVPVRKQNRRDVVWMGLMASASARARLDTYDYAIGFFG